MTDCPQCNARVSIGASDCAQCGKVLCSGNEQRTEQDIAKLTGYVLAFICFGLAFIQLAWPGTTLLSGRWSFIVVPAFIGAPIYQSFGPLGLAVFYAGLGLVIAILTAKAPK